MSKASTTHVIEIETGIGEPAFIPLTLGQEVQPISLGRKGMWKLESTGILDVHAFMYFDGKGLFLQSADEAAAALVDGFRVGKTWTELKPPCKIDIGSARLRFVCLADEAREKAEAERREAARREMERREMERREAERREMERLEAERREAERQAAERLEAQRREMERRVRVPTGPPPEALASTRHERGRRVMTGPPPFDGGDYPTMNPIPVDRTADMPLDPMLAHGSPAMSPVAYYPTARHAPTGPPPYAHPSPYGSGNSTAATYQPYPGQPSAAYNSVPPGYGSMTGGQVGGTHGGGVGPYVARYRMLSTPKRILVVLAPFCIAAAAYLLLFDTAGPAPSSSGPDAGDGMFATNPQPIAVPPVQTPAAPIQPQAPPQPPTAPAPLGCPPGFVPYPVQVPPGAAIPCVPAGTPMPAPSAATPAVPTTPTPSPAAPSPDPSAALAARTLERQAVDFVAANDFAHAAAVYEMLQQQNPLNRVYAEAARILRNKADAGAAAPPTLPPL